MSAIYNRRYDEAPLELAYVNVEGKRVPFEFPLRFAEEDREKALAAHARSDIMVLVDLSIPPFIYVDDSILA